MRDSGETVGAAIPEKMERRFLLRFSCPGGKQEFAGIAMTLGESRLVHECLLHMYYNNAIERCWTIDELKAPDEIFKCEEVQDG